MWWFVPFRFIPILSQFCFVYLLTIWVFFSSFYNVRQSTLYCQKSILTTWVILKEKLSCSICLCLPLKCDVLLEEITLCRYNFYTECHKKICLFEYWLLLFQAPAVITQPVITSIKDAEKSQTDSGLDDGSNTNSSGNGN